MIYYIVIQQTHVWKQQSVGCTTPMIPCRKIYSIPLAHILQPHPNPYTYVCSPHVYVSKLGTPLQPLVFEHQFWKKNMSIYVNVTYSYAKSYPIIMNIILWRCFSPFLGGHKWASPRSLRGATARGDGLKSHPQIHSENELTIAIL